MQSIKVKVNQTSSLRVVVSLVVALCAVSLSHAATWDGGKGSADAACKDKIDKDSAYKHSRTEVVGDFARCYVKAKEGKGEEIYNALAIQDNEPQETEAEKNDTSTSNVASDPAASGSAQAEENCSEPPLAYASMTDDEPVGPGKDYSTTQKEKVRQKNKDNNGGKLMSDDKDDPWYGKELVEPIKGKQTPGNYAPAPKNQAEVDHIFPKSAGGSNSYSNARVVSKEYNTKTSDKGHKKSKKCK